MTKQNLKIDKSAAWKQGAVVCGAWQLGRRVRTRMVKRNTSEKKSESWGPFDVSN
jgi:hypothetical protein